MAMQDRATTKEKKKEVLDKLLELWEHFPQERLLQMVSNSLQGGDTFYIEDYALIRAIKARQETNNKLKR